MPDLPEYSIAVLCQKCGKHVPAVACGGYLERDDEDPALMYQYFIMKCPTCRRPFLVCATYGGGHTAPIDEAVLYPCPKGRFDESVPEAIATSHYEAEKCFDAKAYTACAIICRRTVELMCREKGATKFNLKDKLVELKANGILEARLHEWADYALRDAGNDAAHNLDYVATKEIAQDQLDFSKVIIEYVYVFAACFDRFKTRRAKAAGVELAGGDACPLR